MWRGATQDAAYYDLAVAGCRAGGGWCGGEGDDRANRAVHRKIIRRGIARVEDIKSAAAGAGAVGHDPERHSAGGGQILECRNARQARGADGSACAGCAGKTDGGHRGVAAAVDVVLNGGRRRAGTGAPVVERVDGAQRQRMAGVRFDSEGKKLAARNCSRFCGVPGVSAPAPGRARPGSADARAPRQSAYGCVCVRGRGGKGAGAEIVCSTWQGARVPAKTSPHQQLSLCLSLRP